MGILKKLGKVLFPPPKQQIKEDLVDSSSPPAEDKIDQFNELAPPLFAPRLEQLGYRMMNIENFKKRTSIWSTHHFYQNKKLNLILDIEQSPYYTDYGFSIFIFDSTQPNQRQLLCNVPHEIQDKEHHFLTVMRDKFFSDRK